MCLLFDKHGWVESDDLQPGMLVLALDEEWRGVKCLKPTGRVEQAYNFESPTFIRTLLVMRVFGFIIVHSVKPGKKQTRMDSQKLGVNCNSMSKEMVEFLLNLRVVLLQVINKPEIFSMAY